MKTRLVMVVGVFAFLSISLGAQAQGVVDGAEHGAAVGNRDAGPVGTVVGGAVGGVVGGVEGGVSGILGLPYHHHHHHHHHYSVRQRMLS